MRVITIDCAGVTSLDDFWQRYVDATNPAGAEHFGRNLDAFWDAIERGGPGWPGNVGLVFANSDGLSALRTAGGSEFLPALRKIAAETTGTSVLVT